ncbi:hypothetical protein Z517_04472 [Fonsecaea pedrosoi CBS 271.37]|uniref:Xylanolytic transcriptional activator regulatory domain-containing protein n=1 Tax=Fonsecaea pedrosoi CBS 271.37 TaxID=1442368 RepID=A0A0D2F482_9EURO|nr:uncharacterized protein Z517_04472 [Fonsecaea pedrosoi CBS 271.37]KIW81447.1 hypothetical protein Z517_04472 [Fonsecaea pedrosoi CBS 271.37]
MVVRCNGAFQRQIAYEYITPLADTHIQPSKPNVSKAYKAASVGSMHDMPPEKKPVRRPIAGMQYVRPARKAMPPTKHYIEALHARVKSLERQLHACQQHGSLSTALDFVNISPSVAPTLGGEDARPAQSHTRELDLWPTTERGPLDELTETAGQLDIAEDGHLRFFGAPSYFNLLKSAPYLTTRSTKQDDLDLTMQPNTIDVDLSYELQTHLLNLFWRWQNPWQYLIHRQAFCRAFESRLYDEYCTPLLLRCVLALGSRYCDHPGPRLDARDANTAGDLLAAQAKDILSVEIEHPSTSTTAALAILALREMSVNKETLGWIYIGMAVRIAYNLGLNLDCQKWVHRSKITEEQSEIRRITWWGCYLLDKLFNIGLGRPSMIRESDITAPKPTLLKEEEFSPWTSIEGGESTQPLASHCVTNLRYMTTIFQLASPTLDSIYGPNSELSFSEKQEMATKTHVTLTEQYSNLPSILKLPHSTKTALPAHIYSLHLQYHTVIILLHRPFLRREEQLASFPDLDPLSHRHICTSSAEAVSSILRAYRSSYTLRRIPISTVHAVGTASVILLLNATSNDAEISRAAIRLLKFNMACLQEMSTAWSWSLRAIRSLQILAEKWAVNEKLHAQNNHKAENLMPTGLAMHELNIGGPGPGNDNSSNTTHAPIGTAAAAASPTSPDNIDWLLSFDSVFPDPQMDYGFFDQDIWEMDVP